MSSILKETSSGRGSGDTSGISESPDKRNASLAVRDNLKCPKTARIVVIGAGAAGIAAAVRLLENGFENVVILEAENRIGGRIHTIPFADNVVDLGAQWCHGQKDNVVYDTVKDLDVLDTTGRIYYDFKLVRSNREIVADDVAKIIREITFDSIPQRRAELVGYPGSLGSYLTEKYWREVQKYPHIDKTIAREFLEYFRAFESSVEGCDTLFEVSGQGHLELWPSDGELLLNWRDKGFKSFLRILMKSQANAPDDLGILNNRVLMNRRVSRIVWKKEDARKSVLIKCFNAEEIEADHVICTVPLGVLKEQHKELFVPELPRLKVRAIEGINHGIVGKFFIEFEQVFGPADWTGFVFCWLQKDLEELRKSEYFWLEGVFGFFRTSYQPRIIEGWVIGSHCRHMESLPESEVLSALIWLFRRFFTFPVPEPINFKRTQWYVNPNFRGSYSYRSLRTDEVQTGAWDLAAPLTDNCGKPIVQFAGEATSFHYYSLVHGAVESGWREVQRLCSYYEGRPSHL